VIAYSATLDVPRELAWFVAKLLLAEWRRRGTPKGSRALSCFRQAVLGLRWFRDRTTCEALARDHRVSRATAYRYVDEVIAVLADEAPELREALERAKDAGFSHVILDGKVIPVTGAKSPPSARSEGPLGSAGYKRGLFRRLDQPREETGVVRAIRPRAIRRRAGQVQRHDG
jgi:hypothetical protein